MAAVADSSSLDIESAPAEDGSAVDGTMIRMTHLSDPAMRASPRILGPRASQRSGESRMSLLKFSFASTPHPKSRFVPIGANIATYGRNLDPSADMDTREKALRELAKMLTKIDDADLATTYDQLKRHGITWKLVALITELQAGMGAVQEAAAAGSCPSPPHATGTLLRWCLSCMANLTYFGGADLLKEPGVLHILLYALSSTDATIVSYAVVGMSNVSGDPQCAHFLDKSGALPRLEEIAADEVKPDVARRAKRILQNMKVLQSQVQAQQAMRARCLSTAWSCRITVVCIFLGLLLVSFVVVYAWIWIAEHDPSRVLVGAKLADIDDELTKEITAHPHIAMHDGIEHTQPLDVDRPGPGQDQDGGMFLEIFNCAFAVFAATEIAVWKSRLPLLRPAVLAFALNGLLSERVQVFLLASEHRVALCAHTALHLAQYGLLGATRVVIHPVVRVADAIGTPGIVAIEVTVVCAAVLTARYKQLQHRNCWLAAASMLSATPLVLSAFGFRWDDLLHRIAALKILCVGCVFLMACFWDCKRHAPHLSPSLFIAQAGIATTLVLPVVPCIALALATFFMAIICLCDAVGQDTAFLNPAIYYGVLYGPFAAVYAVTKRRCIRRLSPLPLPLSAPSLILTPE